MHYNEYEPSDIGESPQFLSSEKLKGYMRALDCSQVSDGAAGLVLVNDAGLRRLGKDVRLGLWVAVVPIDSAWFCRGFGCQGGGRGGGGGGGWVGCNQVRYFPALPWLVTSSPFPCFPFSETAKPADYVEILTSKVSTDNLFVDSYPLALQCTTVSGMKALHAVNVRVCVGCESM